MRSTIRSTSISPKPIAQAWVDYVPTVVQKAASNYFNSIDDLFSGINGLLQGKPRQGRRRPDA
jgi:ABC-type transporter lipoprotein component MlaA